MTNEQIAIKQHLSKPAPHFGACACIGPKMGEPLCYCAMQMVEIVDGKWYEVTEHRGPDGITHTAKCLGEVKIDLGYDKRGCPTNDRFQCKNMNFIETSDSWYNYKCDVCGASIKR